MMFEYSVYELTGPLYNNETYIGVIEAETTPEALEKAQRVFGLSLSPLRVKLE